MKSSKPEVLAIIPARGGSKSIPRKNVRLFAGHPLLAFSIAAALQAETVTRTIISTDDEDMARIARELGAEAPFIRPAEFAQDNTLDLPVFEHALTWLAKNEGYKPQIVVQLRPTSPLRPRGLVDEAVQLLLKNPKADSARGVVPSGQNPHKMWRVDANGQMQPLLKVKGIGEPYNAPRQNLPATYWQTGHVDAIRSSVILNKHSMSGEMILPVLVDPRYSVDIDTMNDWQRGEWLATSGELDAVWPGPLPRPYPKQVKLLVLDFDGVLSDNRVWMDENGKESIAANRSDSLGLEKLKQSGVQVFVLSREGNPVVARRCEKLQIGYRQGIKEKGEALRQLLAELSVPAEATLFLGNDTNDLPCFPIAGCAVAVADSHPAVLRQADQRLTQRGGHGAVRELCDLIMAINAQRTNE
ncbi:MAG: acylneuraminate cytidylyltransferase [Anaerolineales bacterium]|nr:MAG: acylneuraminate cytidylyltransferase [Anaerolineales bacterium]